MKTLSIALLSIALLTLSTDSVAQDKSSSKFGKGISIMGKDSSFTMKFSTRFQNLFMAQTTTSDDWSGNDISTNFLVRRMRLKFGGYVYSPRVKYKIELGLSNRDHGSPIAQTKNSSRIILDAVLKWNFAGNFELWAGQTKLPGNRERVISSQKLQFVDRSDLNSKYNLDRDMGVQLRHKAKLGSMVIREAVALSQGEGRNITSNNAGGYNYTARVELLPMGNFTSKGDYFGSDLKREETAKLSIGATYDHHEDAARQQGNMKSFMARTETLNSTFVDFMFKVKGLSIMGEFADKQAKNDPVVTEYDELGLLLGVSSFYVGQGYNIQAGYLLKNNVEIAGRYTFIDPDNRTGRSDYSVTTFGVSKYVVGHSLKVQTDVSVKNTRNRTEDDILYRLQFEISF